MGMFSWNCKGCGHSILSRQAVCEGECFGWMTQAVALERSGATIVGEYNGYGCIDDRDIWEGGEPCMYHRKCWELLGRPSYSEPSESAGDQGYFFEDGEHDMPEPMTVEDVTRFPPPDECAHQRNMREAFAKNLPSGASEDG